MTQEYNKASFEDAYATHYWIVYRYCLRRIGDEDDARDATATTFTTAWRRWDSRQGTPKPWLLGIARKTLANEYRSRRRRNALTAKVVAIHSTRLEQKDDKESVVELAMANLEAADRELLELAYWDDLTLAELASLFGQKYQTVASRLRRAKARFEKEYSRHHSAAGAQCDVASQEG